ncbi:type II toxin-antitoxin system RelE family toxin [Alteromonas oceanisediminis]|uniref:type II toxin-antitoxin system RelE family toxin n=1 Tax=Alteromonas oceanisediminis TaxID=2836180 RepID=UPI001BD9FEF0|nr:type II toxin-antitoxin system RelE/ParE family toxin [Alteromonas oceanisediminis]MBT0586949.1 type II toxin-antitoxin system RelE/ParE family toxin [Alteromonas oceanisediminis]
MEKYKVTFKKSVEKDFRALPTSDIKKILSKIDSLAENPRRDGAIKLSGNNLYRIRQGLYRIIYEIREHELVVQVIKVGHRSDVYKRT